MFVTNGKAFLARVAPARSTCVIIIKGCPAVFFGIACRTGGDAAKQTVQALATAISLAELAHCPMQNSQVYKQICSCVLGGKLTRACGLYVTSSGDESSRLDRKPEPRALCHLASMLGTPAGGHFLQTYCKSCNLEHLKSLSLASLCATKRVHLFDLVPFYVAGICITTAPRFPCSIGDSYTYKQPVSQSPARFVKVSFKTLNLGCHILSLDSCR